jgi:hypothetical protein
VSSAHIRALCDAGLVEAEATEGGQWRVPVELVARLKKDGIPPIPRRMPREPYGNEDRREIEGPTPPTSSQFATTSQTATTSSSAVAVAAEEVEILRNGAQAIQLKKEIEIGLDFFREREQRQINEQRTRIEAERRAEEQAQQESRRNQWLHRWVEKAVQLIPFDAPVDTPRRVRGDVLAALDDVRADEPANVIEAIVQSVVSAALEPWNLQRRIQDVIQSAAASMPREIQVQGNQWHAVALQSAAQAVRERPDASIAELQAAANLAVSAVRREYEYVRARRRLVDEVIRRTFPMGHESDTNAREAGCAAVSNVQIGATTAVMTQLIEKAIAPELARVNAQIDAEHRERLVTSVRSYFYAMDAKDKESALATVRAAIAKHPRGTPEDVLIRTRDQAVKRLLAEHEKRHAIEQLADRALDGLYAYLSRLGTEYKFDKPLWTLQDELKPAVQASLIDTLTGGETLDEASKLMRRRVRRELGL